MTLRTQLAVLSCVVSLVWNSTVSAGIGDPQLGTDHPWYSGELDCSTFERLFAAQARIFERVTGHAPQSDQDRVLAAWMWRNLHYAHGEEGKEDLWGRGFQAGDTTTRDYWTGLFAHGNGLCGTTHAQWTAELNALLGHGRSRTVGVVGHNSCEVFLQGGPYGAGRWALLDHDISTVVFDPQGERLLAIDEIRRDLVRLIDVRFQPQRQQGWPLGGLHADDPQAFAEFRVVEHLPGYAGPPPLIHLRRGETLRRYFQPGLEDGQTFVFWGRNYRTAGIPGPERSRTWVNQPERFYGSAEGSGYRPGQFRYANAVYTYRPGFRDGSYREAVIDEGDAYVVFEFQTPYIIAATPPDDSDWGIYQSGCRNGLVLRGQGSAAVSVSVDRGGTWRAAGQLDGQLDLTDLVKGHRQYWLRFAQPARDMAGAELEIVTVCQANAAVFPHLKANGSAVRYAATGQAVVSAGPTRALAERHVVDGAFDSNRVVLELQTPRGAPATRVYAVAHVASSNPPDPEVRYDIELSVDRGQAWQPVVADWRIVRQGVEPADFWSQSFCYGAADLSAAVTGPVQLRFRNNGGKRFLRAEAHLVYQPAQHDRCRVTFAWSDDLGSERSAEHVFDSTHSDPWTVPTGGNVRMRWVECEPVP